MMETIEGTIKSIKKNKKGFMLNEDGNWYSNDYLPQLIIDKGDKVRVEYKLNGAFRNYDKVTVLEQANEQHNITPEKVTSNKVSGVSVRDTSFYVAYAKDMFIAQCEQGALSPECSAKTLMLECVDLVKFAKAEFEQ